MIGVDENEGCKPDPIMRKMASALQPSNVIYIILETAVGNIQSFTQRTQRTAEKHREDQEKLDIHDD